ncbi:hypothetical protein BGW38_007294, partial [Lunasporangiospora selenospora]
MPVSPQDVNDMEVDEHRDYTVRGGTTMENYIPASDPEDLELEEIDVGEEVVLLKKQLQDLAQHKAQVSANANRATGARKLKLLQLAENTRYEYESTQRLLQDMEADLKRLEPTKQEVKKNTVAVLDTIPKHVIRYDGKRQTARAFLSQFRRLLTAHLGAERFEQQCERLMVLCIDEEHYAIQFQEGLKPFPAESRGWTICQQVFINACLTQAQRDEEVERLTRIGMFELETYQNFAIRIERDLHVYGVKDDNDLILNQLEKSIGTMTYNQMLTNHRFTNPMARSFTKLSDFLTECKMLKGPEGADVTKVYLDAPTVEKHLSASRNKT